MLFYVNEPMGLCHLCRSEPPAAEYLAVGFVLELPDHGALPQLAAGGKWQVCKTCVAMVEAGFGTRCSGQQPHRGESALLDALADEMVAGFLLTRYAGPIPLDG